MDIFGNSSDFNGVINGNLEVEGDTSLEGDLNMNNNDILNAGTINYTALNPPISGGGDVSGPASSTDNAIARFDGVTGKLIQDTGVNISDTNEITGFSRLESNNTEYILSDTSTIPLGNQIVAVGQGVLAAYNTGLGSITAIGRLAGNTYVGGSDATFLGELAGLNYTSGGQCTFVGGRSGTDLGGSGSYNNITVLGCNTFADASNQVMLGNTGVSEVVNQGDGTCDLGTASHRFKDLNMLGTATIDGNLINNTGAFQHNGSSFQIQGSSAVQIQNSSSCTITPAGPLLLKGFATTGDVTLNSNTIKLLADPVDPQDGATKAYVDLATTPATYTANKVMKSDNSGNLVTATGFFVDEDKNNDETLRIENGSPRIEMINDTNNTASWEFKTPTDVLPSQISFRHSTPTDGEIDFVVLGNSIFTINDDEITFNQRCEFELNVLANVGQLSNPIGKFVWDSQPSVPATNKGLGTIAIGSASLSNNTTIGTDNVCIGVSSGSTITDGKENVCLGLSSGSKITTGSQNVYLGANSGVGLSNITTNGNIALGPSSFADGGNAICIGFNAGNTTPNTAVIGNNITSMSCQTLGCDLGTNSIRYNDLWLDGQAHINTIAPDAQLMTIMGGIYIGARPVVSSGFVLTGSDTVANTIVETDLIGSGSVGVGSLSSAANSAKVGTSSKLTLSGSFDNAGAGAANDVTIRIKLGTQTINTFLIDTDAVNANSAWQIDCHYTVTAIGVAGNIKSACTFAYQDLGVRKGQMINIPVQLLDTTQIQDLSVTAQWNSANLANTITVDQMTTTLIYQPM